MRELGPKVDDARLTAVLAALLGATVIATPTTSGSPFWLEYGGPRYAPDGVDHSFCFGAGLTTNGRTWARSAMTNLDVTTDSNGAGTQLYRVETATCSATTDVEFQEQTPVPGGGRGFSACVTMAAYGIICDKAVVRVDTVQIFIENGGYAGNPSQLDVNIYKTFHHEAGHTAGLGHWTGVEMMVEGAVPNNWQYTTMTAHEACHINNYFPGAPNCTP